MVDIDPRWPEAIDLVVAGLNKVQVAARIGVHRNTMTAWCKHPAFIAELQRRLDELEVVRRLSRSVHTSAYADRLRDLADSALSEAERRPLDRGKQLVVRHWLRMYRALLAEERLLLG